MNLKAMFCMNWKTLLSHVCVWQRPHQDGRIWIIVVIMKKFLNGHEVVNTYTEASEAVFHTACTCAFS